MKEQDVIDLGFKLTDKYRHDQYTTYRYTKGVLQVEFTYEDTDLVAYDLSVEEVISMAVNVDILKALTPILGEIKPGW